MNTFGRPAGLSWPRRGKEILVSLSSLPLLFAIWPQNLQAYQDAQEPAQSAPAPPVTQSTPEQLQQLVAPIALYPDSLVAQILAASTFPAQVVEADRWLQAHPGLQGEALAQAVDQQPWDPSVKALTAFQSVLGNMDKNLAWTSSLGDAYYNQQQEVMDAIQVMRQRAQAAGNLKTTSEQTVTTQGSTIIVEPADPAIVYVPAYDPWIVYGYPIVAWPGWYPYPGIWFGGPYLSFGVGFGIGFFGGFGWGWGNWGFDWHHGYPLYNHERYYSQSNTFYNRNNYYRGGGEVGVARNVQRGESGYRGGDAEHFGEHYDRPAPERSFNGDPRAARGYTESRGESGTRSGAFSGYGHGGDARAFSERGSASFGDRGFGGGGFGGGGFHGGGGGRH